MNYGKIKTYCISNGEGLRTALFVTGCPIHCKGCFNPELQAPTYGEPYTADTYNYIKSTMNEHIKGLSILGGEPLAPYNVVEVYKLCEQFKTDFPAKDIWLWTGYTFEQLKDRVTLYNNFYEAERTGGIVTTDITEYIVACYATADILNYIDVLVDGPFVEELKNLNLAWRGSSNQSVIDIPKTMKEGHVVLWKNTFDET